VCTPLATDRRALVIVKPDCDCAIDAAFWRCVRLLTAQGVGIFIEPPAMRRLRLLEQELGVDPFMVVLQTWDAPVGSCGGVLQRAPPPPGMAFEVAISIGGDGTLLWLSHLFGDAPMPPVLPIALGTLGFLTPFSVKEMDVTLGAYLTSPSAQPIALRSRLVCRIHRAGGVIVVGDEPQIVLNELLVERGSDGGGRLAALDIFVDGVLLTRLVGDGLIVATPCGSTGYSLAAGGALAHPSANGAAAVTIPLLCSDESARARSHPAHAQVRPQPLLPPTLAAGRSLAAPRGRRARSRQLRRPRPDGAAARRRGDGDALRAPAALRMRSGPRGRLGGGTTTDDAFQPARPWRFRDVRT